MLEAFKAAGAFANLMRNRDSVVQAVDRVKKSLESKKVTGEGGGGAVRVTMNARGRVLDMQIDSKLWANTDDDSRKMAQQIVADAVNKAIAKAQEAAGKEISREMASLGLPMIPGLEALRGV
jgi:DNA-binding YbaB/EbfC family protein